MPSTKLAPRGLTSAASLRTERGTALTSPAPRCAHTPMPFGAASVTREPVIRCCRSAVRFGVAADRPGSFATATGTGDGYQRVAP